MDETPVKSWRERLMPLAEKVLTALAVVLLLTLARWLGIDVTCALEPLK